MGKLDAFVPKLWPWVALGLAVLVLLQQLRVADLQVDLAKAGESQAKTAQLQAQKEQAATEKDASALLVHAANTQDNIYDYAQTIQKLETGRAADAARIASLQHHLRTTATQHAQAASDAAACRDLADQHQRLAALAVQGAGVVGELGDLVPRRDAQVALLRGHIATDRKLLEQIQ